MNQRQQNSHTMHAAVLDLLDRHAASWTGLPPVADAVAVLRGAFDRAATLDGERRALGTTGLTAAKADRRDAMEAAALRLVRALRPYARAGDPALLTDVDLAARDFDRATDADAIGLAVRVRTAAESHLAGLAAYGVGASDVAALAAAIEAFRPLGADRDATSARREARTATLPAAFAEARAALDLLDDLVPGVVADPALTAEYVRARRTDDR